MPPAARSAQKPASKHGQKRRQKHSEAQKHPNLGLSASCFSPLRGEAREAPLPLAAKKPNNRHQQAPAPGRPAPAYRPRPARCPATAISRNGSTRSQPWPPVRMTGEQR